MKKEVLKGHIVHAPVFGELEIIENGYLLLEDGVIRGITPELPPEYRDATLTDFGDKIIMQSFSDMHIHAPQYVYAGIGFDLPLMEWLPKYAFPSEAIFKDVGLAREVYAGLAAELVSRGTTRVCAFSSLHTDASLALMETFEKAGITGYVGKVAMDRNALPGVYQEDTEDSVQEQLRFLNESERFSSVRPIITPRFTPACTDRLMEALGKIRAERDLPVQSHLSENLKEIETVRTLCPDCSEYWETYDRYGLLTDRTVMAHCVWCSDREMEALKARGVTVAHCPDSNINIMSGLAPVREMLGRGVQIALGSDIAGGAEISMNRVMTNAIRMSKARRINSGWTEEALSVREAYYLGTSAGAAFFGAKPGLAVGDRLHAIVADDGDLPLPGRLNVSERFERLIYLMEKPNIVAVYSDGKRVR